MQTTLVFYLFIALVVSISIAYFQYYFKVKNKIKQTRLLFFLKTLSVFLLFLLLINPKIENLKTTNEKPVLSLLIDNSSSLSFFKEENNVANFIKNIQTNNDLSKKFDIESFTFGSELKILDSLHFIEGQTNISQAIQEVNQLQQGKIAPVLLITDGNQTIGQDYEFTKSNQPIYPIVFGDTTAYADVKISQLNVNKYSYIKNRFPVEVILNYEGDSDVTTQFSIYKKGKTVFRKNLRFSKVKKSATITASLTSTEEGTQYYTASVAKIDNEKNTKNNSKSFSVEVIDEQTKVLLLTSIKHPDLGAFKKAIESNKQRSVEIRSINDFNTSLEEYQLVILYQPNNKYNDIVNSITEKNIDYFLVSGAATDWDFINKKQLGFVKNAINETENYGAIYNDGFLTFLQNDIGFGNLPPLKDKFGDVNISKEHQTILFQSINGVQTQRPLLATIDANNQKSAILMGEGIWRWRANSFLKTNSFEDFDKLIGNIVQYLASNKKRSRLEINAESLYPANTTIKIAAFYTDKNYQFDARANLELEITNLETKQIKKVPFSLWNNSFHAEIEDLSSGDYSYKVSVIGQKIQKNGRFKISDYKIEEQFTNANVSKLQNFAANNNGKVFYKNQSDTLIIELLENPSYYTVQKASIQQENLIDWKWILIIVAVLLSTEWFVRKYFGKI